MTKKAYITALTIFVTIAAAMPAHAQFMNLSMEVEPELSVEVVQDLNFGAFIANSGIQRINKNSPNIGIFEIRAFGNQNVVVSLNIPDSLTSSDPSVQEQVPLTLRASYSNIVNRSAANSVLIDGNRASFPISQTSPLAGVRQWQQAYIYIFGEVMIGDIPQGEYTGSLVLSVEYQ